MKRVVISVKTTFSAFAVVAALSCGTEAQAAINLELRTNPTVTGLGGATG